MTKNRASALYKTIIISEKQLVDRRNVVRRTRVREEEEKRKKGWEYVL
jgi:hypothetical protein